MSSDYSYKYKPTGKYTDDIVEWFKNQKNKADSLTLLIRQAQNKYGNQDLVDMTTQAFLDDKLMVQKPVEQPTPTTPVNDNSQAVSENNEVETIEEEDTSEQEEQTHANPSTSSTRKKSTITHTNPKFKPKPKPNLGFLHEK